MYRICVTNRHLAGCSELNSELIFEKYLNIIENVLKGNNGIKPDALILREKDLEMSDYFKLASDVIRICEDNDVKCILHNYTEVADSLKADYLHLPYSRFVESTGDMSIMKIGTSVHSVEDAVKAEKEGAAYITAGHIYETDCKKGLKGRGITFLKEVCRSVSIPVYAIGGIKEENAKECISAGAAGVCIMSGYMKI